jgi:hypothetical protein
MEPVVLTDPSVIPDDQLVFSIIGDKSVYWEKIIAYLYDNYKDISVVWRFYNDGKTWLFRALKKDKTIFWIGVIKDTFRVTFYFGDKANPVIEQSELPENIKSDFRNAKKFNTIRGVTITMADQSDASNVIKLIDLKMRLK